MFPRLVESTTGVSDFTLIAFPNKFFIVIIIVDADLPSAIISVGLAITDSFDGLFHKKIRSINAITTTAIIAIYPKGIPPIPPDGADSH